MAFEVIKLFRRPARALAILCLAGVILACEPPEDAMRRLHSANNWFIEHGLGELMATGDVDPTIRRLKEMGVYLRAEIRAIDKPDPLPLYVMLALRADNQHASSADCYFREKIDGRVYEYWVLKLGTRRTVEIKFVLVQGDGVAGTRRIVHHSPKFLESYTFPDGTKIDFPPITPVLVSSLIPHLDPDAYRGSAFYNKRAVMKDGKWAIVEAD